MGVLVAIALLLWLIISMMPKGFSMTHEKIGAGKPALVFIYDPNLAVSISQPEQMNIARDTLSGEVVFLIAKIGTPEGNQLITQYRAKTGELLLFDATGNLIKRQYALINARDLIQWFDLSD